MTFTDEDISDTLKEIALGNAEFISVDKFRALIARLKAAEDVAMEWYCSTMLAETSYKAWRKACGK